MVPLLTGELRQSSGSTGSKASLGSGPGGLSFVSLGASNVPQFPYRQVGPTHPLAEVRFGEAAHFGSDFV